MSILPLPGDVVAQIKSSAAITSLNNAIYGLVQNSLDAGATKINISVDYRRGNCSVEDNGVGIPPANFREDGGLGQPHYTSKYPARTEFHGRNGEFLASLAALSLLTITSHHRDYRSHNSLTIHNSRIVARRLPAPPDQQVLLFPSGTRVSVRDLFGSMPVRVKQRAAEVERLGTARFFDQLTFINVALLLAWPGEVVVHLQESNASRAASLHLSAIRSAAQDIVARSPRLLAEASLLDHQDARSWVSVGATASGVSVTGCVSLQPAATKNVQFISLGIQPLLNEHHSNFLYDEVNKVFANSGFGVVEEARVDEDGHLLKTSGFTSRELKSKKGVDRWPMFFLRISLEGDSRAVNVDELLDDGHQSLAVITDLLQVMSYEFLKKHHFGPRSLQVVESLRSDKRSTSASSSSRESSASESVSAKSQSISKRPSSKPELRKKAASHRAVSRSLASRSASPFASWPRSKSSAEKDPDPKTAPASLSTLPETSERSSAHFVRPTTPPILTPAPTFFNKTSGLVRRPFNDDGEPPAPYLDKPETDRQPDPTQLDPWDEEVEAIVWVDPVTKSKSLIDPRTGFGIRSKANGADSSSQKRRNESSDINSSARIQRSTKTTPEPNHAVFLPTEPPIPRLPQDSETLACQVDGRNHDCHATAEVGQQGVVSKGLEGRITKNALQKLEIINQVDKKFILVKAFAGQGSEYLLVLIDQHAADERCRVEDLLKRYFRPDLANPGKLVAETQSLDKTLRFDLSKREAELLARYKQHFAQWGIAYNVMLDQQMPLYQGKGTVEVRMLPPCILERCQLEPRLLIELLRKEAWKVHDDPSRQASGSTMVETGNENEWLARFHNCPQGIMEMINSKACRSAIMFNDVLNQKELVDLVKRLAACAFPFQCAHGRPSMVPVVHIGEDSTLGASDMERERRTNVKLSGGLRRWKDSMR
ncbi:putative DNA mismatch repair protein MLH3 [Cladorrhinum samala]|uniref:DNA mismatch repair protein MLH3 n=1 Tax=Cladorrhinum samala TaxID=585594 RepID=A0AAV9HV78_9PEZI|nr:putative DNA mismatch repair protein MLH3 [Cladorrhinum samala]